MNTNPAWNRRADGPMDDPLEMAIEAIDQDPAQLHECVCRVVRTGAFDDLFFDCIRDSALGAVAKDLVQAVRTEVAERAAENIWSAREYRREAREGR